MLPLGLIAQNAPADPGNGPEILCFLMASETDVLSG